MKTKGLFLLMNLIVAFFFPLNAIAQSITETIQVSSQQPWTDTGLTVSEGDIISITASGTVIFGDPHTSENTTGPDGKTGSSGSCNFVVTNPNVPAQSLIGNIADSSSLDGKGFFVGSDFEGTVPISNTTTGSGNLFLGFNDGAVYCDRSGYDSWGFGGDNHGYFTAEVTIEDSSSSGISDFVTRFYQQCLNRDPDESGLNNWVNALKNGSKSGADVAYGFVFSDEFINRNTTNSDFVTILYRAFFDREPDSAGHAYWLDKLDNGESRGCILKGFLGSQEFSNLCAEYGISAIIGSIDYMCSPIEPESYDKVEGKTDSIGNISIGLDNGSIRSFHLQDENGNSLVGIDAAVMKDNLGETIIAWDFNNQYALTILSNQSNNLQNYNPRQSAMSGGGTVNVTMTNNRQNLVYETYVIPKHIETMAAQDTLWDLHGEDIQETYERLGLANDAKTAIMLLNGAKLTNANLVSAIIWTGIGSAIDTLYYQFSPTQQWNVMRQIENNRMIATAATAPTAINVPVKVKTPSGLGIEGATVTLSPSNSPFSIPITLWNGWTMISQLTSGSYTVTASHPDYQSNSAQFTIDTSLTPPVAPKIILEQSPNYIEPEFVSAIFTDTPLHGLTWDGSFLWGASLYYNKIYKIDSETGSVLLSWTGPGSRADGLTYDGTYLWISDSGTHKLYKVALPWGGVVASFNSPAQDEADLAWDGQYLWLLDYPQSHIYKIAPNDGSVVSTIPTSAGYNHGITFDGINIIYADIWGDHIVVMDTSGNQIESWHSSAASWGLACDGTYLYGVGGVGGKYIRKFRVRE